LAFCLRESARPEYVAETIGAESKFAPSAMDHVGEWILADWPLRCTYLACEVADVEPVSIPCPD